MAQPTKLPRWADTAPATSQVEPTSGKKDVGWVGNEKPPARYMNWLLYWIYQWILWFKDRTTLRTQIWGSADGFTLASGAAPTYDVVWDAIVGVNTGAINVPITAQVGDRLLSIKLYLYEGSSATHVALYLTKLNMLTGATTAINFTGAVDHVTATGAVGHKSLTGTLDGGGYTLAADERLFAVISWGANGASQELLGAAMSFDTP